MSREPPLERELKFACSDLGSLREKLMAFEAERVAASTFEDNVIFDRAGELEEKRSVLRLRVDGRGARLTFKGPATFERRVKVRVEHEVDIADAGAMRALIESLGFSAVKRYQKYREEWRLGGVTASLDHTPIGDFAEFEGEGVEKLAKRCGFDLDSAEMRTYLRLYQDYRGEHAEAPEDMVFP